MHVFSEENSCIMLDSICILVRWFQGSGPIQTCVGDASPKSGWAKATFLFVTYVAPTFSENTCQKRHQNTCCHCSNPPLWFGKAFFSFLISSLGVFIWYS